MEDKTPIESNTVIMEDKTPIESNTVIMEDKTPIESNTVIMEDKTPIESNTVIMEDKTPIENNTNGQTNACEEATPPSQPLPKEGGQGWRSILALFCCTKPQSDGQETTSPKTDTALESKKTNKKSNKSANKASKFNEDTASVDDLFGKQWFGYSRKKSKKGKAATNLDEIGEVKAVDNVVLKARLDVKPKGKRPPTSQHMKRMISNDVFDNLTPVPSTDITTILEADIAERTETEVEDKVAKETTRKSIEELQMTKIVSQSSEKEEATNPSEEEGNEENKKKSPAGEEEAELKQIESKTVAIDGSSKETVVATTSEVKVTPETAVKDITSIEVKYSDMPKVKDITSTDAAKDAKSPEAIITKLPEIKPTTSLDAKSTVLPEVTATASSEAKVTATSAEVKASTACTSAEIKSSPDITNVVSVNTSERKTSLDLDDKRASQLQSNDDSLVKETVIKSPAPSPSLISAVQILQEPDKGQLKVAVGDKSSAVKNDKSDGESIEQATVTEDKSASEDDPQSTEKKLVKQKSEDEVKKAKPYIAKKPSTSSSKSPSISREMSTDSVDMTGSTDEGEMQSETVVIEPKTPQTTGQSTSEEKKDDSQDLQLPNDSQQSADSDAPAQNTGTHLPPVFMKL